MPKLKRMKFAKVHGIGNDFILINNIEERISIERFPELARRFCRRNFSIGADGILVLENSRGADFRMLIFNSDGSEAEMCGNGIRCIAMYCHEKGLTDKQELEIETLAGIIKPRININEKNQVSGITVDMGKAELTRSKIPMVGPDEPVVSEDFDLNGTVFKITAVSMGNPHCVIFVDDLSTFNTWKEFGARIEVDARFPQRVNVEFVQIESPSNVKVNIWERGAGATLACGTGACAVVVALVLNRKAKKGDEITVSLPGGDLKITWALDEHVYMTGPAEFVFEAEINHD